VTIELLPNSLNYPCVINSKVTPNLLVNLRLELIMNEQEFSMVSRFCIYP